MRVLNHIALTVVLVLFACVVSGFSQQRTFKWSDELCDFRGTYNVGKYTAAQLENTHKLFDHSSFSLQTSATVFSPDDLVKLDLAALEAEYKTLSAKLAALEIVNTPFWQSLRQQKLAEMKQVYELSRLTISGHTNPAILKQLSGSDACKAKYADPLIAGGPTLLDAWRTVNEDSRVKNSDPARLKRIFETQMTSPDRLKYALVEVMTFGWWNCANDAISYVNYDGTQEREFKKLFIRVKQTCSEP